MRSHKILGALGSISFIAFACAFQACGGDDGVKKDGGGDGFVDTDTGTTDGNTGMDSGDMDTGVMDTGVMDSGPTCTNTPCAIALAVGGHHACALIIDGTVRCWGMNASGQLGTFDGGPFNNANRLAPLQVDGLTGVTQVAATTSYAVTGNTCARTSAGGVLCLGNNQAATLGQTATPDNNPHSAPLQVMGLPMGAQVALGRYMGCAVTNGGEYWCWGSNDAFGQTTPGILGHGMNPNGFTAPGKATLVDASVSQGSPGAYHNIALTTGGQVLSWGDNSFDGLGRDTMGNDSPNPAPVTGLSNVTQISAGAFASCALSAGQIHCWGDNTYGQLGRSGIVGGSSLDATIVTALPNMKTATMVTTSGYHSCAVANDGTVYCWGRNNAGQLGNGSTMGNGGIGTPTQVMLPVKAVAVGTGAANFLNNMASTGYSCALLEGGGVMCWGYNGEGELGRTADAGGTMACASINNAACAPNPGAVIWP